MIGSNTARSLVGIAIDPDYMTNHYIYVYYTTLEEPRHNKIVRLTADGDQMVPGSELVLLELDETAAPNHIAGAMGFGTDGKLYVSTGDSSYPDESQSFESYHGKILRLNKEDGSAPADNPFFATGNEKSKRFWAYGFRNPFTMGMHPVNGKIFANDVGFHDFEEINEVLAGHNYGWPGTEGKTTEPGHTTPVFTYAHTGTTLSNGATIGGCAVTGGDFLHEGTNYPAEYVNKYFFVDLCSHWLYYLDPALPNQDPKLFAPVLGNQKIGLLTGPDGNLYFISHVTKSLHKLVYSVTGEPIITKQPLQKSVHQHKPATFTVSVYGNDPFEYQWFKDDVEIEGATESSYTIEESDFDDEGEYSVHIENDEGEVTSVKAKLIVGPPNNLPVAKILLPTGENLYSGADIIEYSGEGTDDEDGTLPAGAFQWMINFHHDEHYHDQPPIDGQTGTFEVPVRGETATNVWYRFILKVTDSAGDFDQDTVDVHPVVAQLVFNSLPTGAQITIDGKPVNTPYSISAVAGMVRDLHAIEAQVIDGKDYMFASWSQGGEALQELTMPSVDTEYTVIFSPYLGTEENKAGEVYPNPAQSNIYIPWRFGDAEPAIQFTDIYGRTHTMPVSRSFEELIVNVSDLPPAIYFLTCVGEAKKFTAKVAIMR